MKAVVITMDGPAGSGKSSLSAALAKHFGLSHVNTGLLYRALAVALTDRGFLDDEHLPDSATISEVLDGIHRDPKTGLVYSGGRDITERLVDPELGLLASRVAKEARVRDLLLEPQRQWIREASKGAVAEGRDVGTIVYPSADLKVWVTASARERAKRRLAQIQESNLSGPHPSLEELQETIRRRDEQDRNRETAPMVPAEDALELDTTNLDFPAALRALLDMVESKRLVEVKELS